MIQQQLEAGRLERSHTPRGVILMWALGPWDQNNCICMVVSGCPHLSGIWGALGNSLIISAALFSLERREPLLRCLQPATSISIFSGFRCHKCRSHRHPIGSKRPVFEGCLVFDLFCQNICWAFDRPTVTVVLFIVWQNNYGLHLFPPKMK